MKVNDVIIVGGGPAGIATAIELKRYKIDPIIFEKDRLGGLLKNANCVENYPGFPSGISGIELIHLFEEHIKKAGIKVIFDEVKKVDYENNTFIVRTENNIYFSKLVAIASGTKPKEYFSEIKDEIKDKVFYEIYPLLSEKGKRIVIVGAGDVAFDYALNLGRRNKIYILAREERIKANPELVEGVKSSLSITYIKNAEIYEIVKKTKNEILIKYRKIEKLKKITAHYIVFAIGRLPSIDFLPDLREKFSELKRKRIIYLIGDIKNREFRQCSISVGDGILTGMKIAKRLGMKK